MAWWTLTLGFAHGQFCFLDYVNLAFHEAGHVLLSWCGKTIYVLGGTIGQLAVPVVVGLHFLVKSRKPFGSAFCLFWLGESLNNVSIYMADARALELPLVGGGEHDWTELFYSFGLLSETSVERISAATHFAGVMVMLAGLAWGVFFVLSIDTRERVRDALTERLPWLGRALES
jgi:hypothetical protein